jgi:hypothetical protein
MPSPRIIAIMVAPAEQSTATLQREMKKLAADGAWLLANLTPGELMLADERVLVEIKVTLKEMM